MVRVHVLLSTAALGASVEESESLLQSTQAAEITIDGDSKSANALDIDDDEVHVSMAASGEQFRESSRGYPENCTGKDFWMWLGQHREQSTSENEDLWVKQSAAEFSSCASVWYAKTNKQTCKEWCAAHGHGQCVRGMDDAHHQSAYALNNLHEEPSRCTLFPSGHDRRTTDEAGCLQRWQTQICACAEPGTLSLNDDCTNDEDDDDDLYRACGVVLANPNDPYDETKKADLVFGNPEGCSGTTVSETGDGKVLITSNGQCCISLDFEIPQETIMRDVVLPPDFVMTLTPMLGAGETLTVQAALMTHPENYDEHETCCCANMGGATVSSPVTGPAKGAHDPAPFDQCPSGKFPMLSDPCKCKAAAEAMGLDWKGETYLKDYTPGCSLRVNHPVYTGVWFNTFAHQQYDGHGMRGETSQICDDEEDSGSFDGKGCVSIEGQSSAPIEFTGMPACIKINGDVELGVSTTGNMVSNCLEDYGLLETHRKCRYQDDSRLWRLTDTTEEECYHKCASHPDCKFFSHDRTSARWKNVCMGCREGVVSQHHTDFNFFEICKRADVQGQCERHDEHKCTQKHILTTSTQGPKACRNECKNNPQCALFAHDGTHCQTCKEHHTFKGGSNWVVMGSDCTDSEIEEKLGNGL